MEALPNIITSPFSLSLQFLNPDVFFDKIFANNYTPEGILNFMGNGIRIIGIPFYQHHENSFKGFLQKTLEVFQEGHFNKLESLYLQIFALFIYDSSKNQIKINIDEIDDFIEKVYFSYFGKDLKEIEEKLTPDYISSKIRISEFQNIYNNLSIILRNLENEFFKILESDAEQIGNKINEQEWRKKVAELAIPQKGKDRYEDQVLQKLKDNKQKLIQRSEEFRNQNRDLKDFLVISKILENNQPAKLEESKYFIRGNKLNIMEGMDIEFKNYIFPLQQDKPMIMKKTICALLNTKGGRIYIGIRDSDLMVFGSNLNMAEKDKIKREIDDLLNDIHPRVEPIECVTKFIPMKDENFRMIPDHYIIKIIVKRGKIDDIYVIKDQNGGVSAYFRRDGKNSSILLPADLKKEIIERNKVDKEKAIKENELYNVRYNDPEPENNAIVIQNLNFMNSNKYNNIHFKGSSLRNIIKPQIEKDSKKFSKIQKEARKKNKKIKKVCIYIFRMHKMKIKLISII